MEVLYLVFSTLTKIIKTFGVDYIIEHKGFQFSITMHHSAQARSQGSDEPPLPKRTKVRQLYMRYLAHKNNKTVISSKVGYS